MPAITITITTDDDRPVPPFAISVGVDCGGHDDGDDPAPADNPPPDDAAAKPLPDSLAVLDAAADARHAAKWPVYSGWQRN